MTPREGVQLGSRYSWRTERRDRTDGYTLVTHSVGSAGQTPSIWCPDAEGQVLEPDTLERAVGEEMLAPILSKNHPELSIVPW